MVYSWRIGSQINLSHYNIIQERKIICIGYKWEGESNRTVLTWDSRHDDKAMLQRFLPVANEADEIIAHYGDGFDMPWFRTRCLFHGLEPLPLYKTVDTKAWASKYFYFNNNKLDYIGDFLGLGKKYDTNFKLWIDVMNGCRKSLAYMAKYCGRDLDQLEKVWNRLRVCVRTKTHAGVFAGLAKWTCAHCGDRDVIVKKRRVTASGTIQWQMQCQKCGGYYSISDQARKDYADRKNTIPRCQRRK